MNVSIIEIGAGSRGLSARPILPTTDSTSGIETSILFCSCRTSNASPIDAWGIVVGM